MGDIISFPMTADVGKARRVAAVWASRRTEKARTRYWQDTESTIRQRMRRIGFDELEIDKQIAGFWSAVCREISTLDACDQQGPGAA